MSRASRASERANRQAQASPTGAHAYARKKARERPRPTPMTAAQEDAMLVLREAHPKRVDSGKRRSRLKPRARVNLRAADALVAMGLARCHLGRFDPYTTTDTFTLTAEGLAKARKMGPAVLSRMP